MDLADVVRRHGPAYLEKYGDRMPQGHRQALEAILAAAEGQTPTIRPS